LVVDQKITSTETGLDFCNEMIDSLHKAYKKAENLEDLGSQVKIAQALTYWMERADSMLRLADHQGKGVQQLTEIANGSKKPRITKNIRPLESEPT
jgi:hypothetical protein